MNREGLRERLAYLLFENPVAPVFFTETVLNRMLHEGIEVLAEEIRDLRQEAFITVEPGRFLYTLPEVSPDVRSIFRVWNEADEDRLTPITMGELDGERERWMEVFSERAYWWFPYSHDGFGIHPGPLSGGAILRVEYIAWPKVLTSDAASPILSEAEQDLIVMYAQHDGLIRQWETDRALDIFQTFSTAFRDQTFKTSIRRMGRMRLDRGVPGDAFPSSGLT